MKTDELVDLLAQGEVAVDAGASVRRASAAFAGAVVVSAALMAWQLGVLPVLGEYLREPMFWVKAGFAVVLSVTAIAAALRLARPGAKLGAVSAAIAAPFIAIWLLAAFSLLRAAPAERARLLFGDTWTECPFYITLLAAPVFVGVLWAMKGFAPTRLALAGAAAGLAAGATGAAVYSLHCPELAAPFLGSWYVIGILIPTVAGALIGPRVLRW
jgi:hypothetical protein